jgi:hypothetical protein
MNSFLTIIRSAAKQAAYLLLFPLFFVLHGYNENFGVISWIIVAKLLLGYCLISSVIFICTIILFRDNNKGFLLAFVCLCLFFFFGSLHDYVNFSLGKTFGSYSVLLTLLFLILTSAVIAIKVSGKRRISAASRYVKWLLLLFLIIEAAIFLYKSAWPQEIRGAALPVHGIKKKPQKNNGKPDIFLVVFDGYTSSACLKSDFGFDNASIDSVLVAHHFFVSRSSKSNYNLTPFSLGSFFNSSYLKVDSQDYVIRHKDLLSAANTVKYNWIVPFLQTKGYVVKNLGVFDFNTCPVMTYQYFGEDYYSAAIDNQTIISRVKRDIAWNFTIRNPLTGSFTVPRYYSEEKERYIARNQFNYDQFTQELAKTSEKPRFVYCHLMLPHEPYYFKADGSLTSDTDIILRRINDKAGYLNQIGYSNLLLKTIIGLSDLKQKRNRIVIIMGDHGFRSYPSKKYRPKTFCNLNCIYSSDGDSELYDGISPINTFRFVLNRYFGQSLPFLKDSSTYLVDPVYDSR